MESPERRIRSCVGMSGSDCLLSARNVSSYMHALLQCQTKNVIGFC